MMEGDKTSGRSELQRATGRAQSVFPNTQSQLRGRRLPVQTVGQQVSGSFVGGE